MAREMVTGLARDGFQVGVNWSGERATGFHISIQQTHWKIWRKWWRPTSGSFSNLVKREVQK